MGVFKETVQRQSKLREKDIEQRTYLQKLVMASYYEKG